MLDSVVVAFAPSPRIRVEVVSSSTTTTRATRTTPRSTAAVASITTTTSLNLFGFKERARVKEGEKQEGTTTPESTTVVDVDSKMQTQDDSTTITKVDNNNNNNNNHKESDTKQEQQEQQNQKQQMANMMKPIREAGPAGALSLFLWEGAFWLISIPVCSIFYYQTTGSWPDWSQKDDVAKVTAEAFAFANIARFALPVRVGLAVATTPWVKENIVDKFGLFQSNDKTNGGEGSSRQ
jgi:hypothetical protein